MDKPGKPRTYDVTKGDGTTVSLPSVTSILAAVGKPALINWAAKVEREMVFDTATKLYSTIKGNPPMSDAVYASTLEKWTGEAKAKDRILVKAGDIGSEIHRAVEWTLRDIMGVKQKPLKKLSEAAQHAFLSWMDWKTGVGLKPVLTEQVVYSLEWGYAGTLDNLSELVEVRPGELNVLDWKSGKAIYPEAALQAAAYWRALEEMGHFTGTITRAMVVRLPKVKGDVLNPKKDIVSFDARQRDRLFDCFLSVKDLWHYLSDGLEEYTRE